MIKCYGLHWRADRVAWGKPGVGNNGTLLGAASRSGKAHPIDFRYQRGIYALYAEYELVYVGQTGTGTDRLFKRLKDHRSDHLSERWDRFSWFGTQRILESGKLSTDKASVNESIVIALNVMEAITIAVAEPRLNLQRGKWGEARPYYQWHSEIGEDED